LYYLKWLCLWFREKTSFAKNYLGRFSFVLGRARPRARENEPGRRRHPAREI
jgi:hypothetical protein